MRLLVVEDEPDIRQSLEKAFRESGYAVDGAEDGEKGLFKATEWDYDAVILDVMLPGMDGWRVLERLREVKSTPVLMLTARNEVRDRVHGLDLGSDDYVVKPFDLQELLARVRAIIRRSAGRAESVLAVASVEIDTARREVRRDGAVVEITAREYALIEYLALRRGSVVTRTELYDHLFDEEDESLSNLLDVHVCNVRKKLGRQFIRTRRGHGYAID